MHQPRVVHVTCILRWCADNTAFINFAFGKWNHSEMFFKRNQWQICNMCLSPKQVSSEMMNSWEDEICTFCRLFAATYLQMCINLPIFSPSSLAVRCLRFFIWHFHYALGMLENNCILSWWKQPEDGLGHWFLHGSALSAVHFWSFP